MKNKITSWEAKRRKVGFYFVLPFTIGSVFFIVIPIIKSLVYSFCDLTVSYDGFNLAFKGFENYYQLFFVDPYFRDDLLKSMWDMIINVPITVIFSFFMASLINQKFRFRTVARGILFLPVILSSGIYIQLSSSDTVTNMTLTGNKGAQVGSEVTSAFMRLLSEMELDSGIISFLMSSVDRIATIVAMSAIPIILFLAGFQSISPSIFESANIEGASKWEIFWKISFPMVSSIILVCVVYTIVDSFTSTSNLMINKIHETMFQSFKYGLGSAMVWVYLSIIFAILGLVYAIINKRIFYYD